MVRAGKQEDLSFPSVSATNSRHIGFLGIPEPIAKLHPDLIFDYLRATIAHAKRKNALLLAIKSRPGQEKEFERAGFMPHHQCDETVAESAAQIFGRPERRQGITTYVMQLA